MRAIPYICRKMADEAKKNTKHRNLWNALTHIKEESKRGRKSTEVRISDIAIEGQSARELNDVLAGYVLTSLRKLGFVVVVVVTPGSETEWHRLEVSWND